MRKLLWFTVGFAAACAVGAWLIFDNTLIWIGAACILLGVAAGFLPGKLLKTIGALLLGAAVGLFWVRSFNAFYMDTAKAHDGKTLTTTVEITDYGTKMDFSIAAQGKLLLNEKSYKIYVYASGIEALRPGDRITGKLTLRCTAAGGERSATHHQGKGIFLLGYFDKDVQVERPSQIPGKYFAAQLRQKILTGLDEVFPKDTAAFAKALLLGYTRELTYAEDVAFQRSGIRHVIAVSGLHISILFSVVYLFTGRKRFFTALLGIPVLFLFSAMSGFTPSVVRACIMQGLVVLSTLVDKEYDPPTALATAVLVMLLANPMTVTAVSFQLSVGCLIGIFLFSRRIHDFLLRGERIRLVKGKGLKARVMRWVVSSVSVCVSAAAITTPLSAFYFGTVSVMGILTNLLTIWCVSFIFCGIMLSCLLGFFWLAAGKAAAWVISWAMRYVLLTAKAISAVPFAAVYTESVYITAWLIFVYILVAVFLILKKRPWVICGCILCSLAAAIFLSWLEPRLDDVRVSVLDVGQGQCILIQAAGQYYMVDCGGDTGAIAADRAANYLLSQGVSHLDGLILTHYDTDHTNGVPNLMTRIRVGKLYLPDTEKDHPMRKQLADICADNTQWITQNTVLQPQGLKITLYTGRNLKDANESGLCILFQRENCDILITGDRSMAGERALLKNAQLPQLELLVVGHHGSKNSTSYDLLSRTRPKTAAISAGGDNRYDMPSGEALERLHNMGIPVWRTDLQGTLIFRG